MKLKAIISIATITLISACGSTPTKPTANEIPSTINFLVEKFDVKLTETIHVDGYPNQEVVTQILREKTLAALSKQNRLATAGDNTAYSTSIQIDYERHFAGDETPIPSKSVASPRVNYTIITSNNGVEKSRTQKSNLIVTKGLGGNLITSFTLGLGKTAKDELIDMETLAQAIAKELTGKK